MISLSQSVWAAVTKYTDWMVHKQQELISHGSRGRKFEIWQIWFLVRVHLLVRRWLSSIYVLMWQKGFLRPLL